MSNGEPHEWLIGEPSPLLGEHSLAKRDIFKHTSASTSSGLPLCVVSILPGPAGIVNKM